MAFTLFNAFTGKERTFEEGDRVIYLKGLTKMHGLPADKGTVVDESHVRMDSGQLRGNFDTNNHKWSKQTGRKPKQ